MHHLHLAGSLGQWHVGSLEFDCNGVWNPDASGLFDLRMPSLQRLHFMIPPGPVCIRSENMPMLRVLKLTRATPEIPTPLTNITHLRYTNYMHILQRDMVQIFSKLPQLQHLTLGLLDAPHIQASTGPRSVVQSLISLEVRWIHVDYSSSLPSQWPLDLSSLPNLQTIVLHRDDPGRECTPLLQSLVCARSQMYTAVLTLE